MSARFTILSNVRLAISAWRNYRRLCRLVCVLSRVSRTPSCGYQCLQWASVTVLASDGKSSKSTTVLVVGKHSIVTLFTDRPPFCWHVRRSSCYAVDPEYARSLLRLCLLPCLFLEPSASKEGIAYCRFPTRSK